MDFLPGSTSTSARISVALLGLLMMVILAGCQRSEEDVAAGGAYPVQASADCLPPVTLLDQHGQQVSLADLKGKPVLFDFIYTSCPGECLMLTQRMKRIANALGPELGNQVRLVSITVDPEHDQPKQLLQYASDQAADMKGWLFLTGTPSQIDAELARFKLIRQHESDGSVDHVLEMFLVGPNGHAVMQYMGDKITAERAVTDLNAAAAGKAISAGDSSIVPVHY
jgi:protein SCO1/2